MTRTPLPSHWTFDANGLHVEATTRADDGVLDAFYPAYDAAFVLPNEKEERQGFVDCLALNAGSAHDALRQRYGDFNEVVLVMRESPGGRVLAGANALVLAAAAGTAASFGYTANLNYLFVDPAQRGRGLSRHLMGACHTVAMQLAHSWNPGARDGGLNFLEINDPFRLTPEQYRLDSEHAGIDQMERLAYWARMGTRIVDWPYVQPALSAEQDDDHTLAFGVIGSSGNALPADWLLHHLERFFAISVLKGEPLSACASAQQQLQSLGQLAGEGAAIALLDLQAALPSLRRELAVSAQERASARPASLPLAIKQS